MKKSFKKAGAAVLSMAMLLAMGSVSMPVYAENPTGATPGSVTVTIPGLYKQGQGDSADVDQNTPDDLKYDYLDIAGVNSATVTMYRVASLESDGWKWDPLFTGTTANAHPNEQEGFTNWNDLLHQVGGDEENKDFFTYSSDNLQKIASYLERVVRQTKDAATGGDSTATTAMNRITVASDTLNNTTKSITLPSDDRLINKIGYYLLVTDTNQAGVVIQPVLVSLKNGSQNSVGISLKGTTIGIEKTVTDAKDTETGYKETGAVSTSGDTAVVAKDDTVSYQIVAQLPTYDSNVTASQIRDYVIQDTADPGIQVLDTDDPATTDVNENTVKVYLSDDATLDTSTDTLLKVTTTPTAETKNNDYVYTAGTGKHGFTVTIKGNQMLGESTGTSLASGTSMKGKYIIITFDATVNEQYTTEEVNAAITAKQNEDDFSTQAAAWRASTGNSEANDAEVAAALVGYKAGDYKFDRTNTAHVKAEDIDDAKIASAAITEAEITNAINKDYYGDEADEGAFTKNAGLTLDLEDTLGDKRAYNPDTGTVDLVYVKDGEENAETFDESEAKKDESNNAITVKVATESNLRNRVKVLLTRDKLNATNGNKNVATMTYGNEYATGGGEATDTDDTKLFSVDLDLDKYTEKLILTKVTADAAGLDVYFGLDNNAASYAQDKINAITAKAATVSETPASTAYDAGMVAAIKTYGGSTITDDAAQKVASLIKADKGYDADNREEVVTNAVFKLTKVYGANKKLISYAASDTNGDLRIVEEATAADYSAYTSDPTTGPVVIKTSEKKEGDSEATDYYYKYTMASPEAWKMLTKGTYEIEEVYAPPGYKKIDGAQTFTVGADQDTTSNEYTGGFTATSGSDMFRNAEEKAKGAAYAAEHPVQFNFNNASGELEQNIYNPLADTLPATGGIGTVLFTAGGISIVLIAGALFVMYMKKRNAEDEE